MTALAPDLIGSAIGVRRIAISADPASIATIAVAGAALGWPPVTSIEAGIAAAVPDIAQGTPPALLIIDLDGEDRPLAALAALADHCLPETRVLAFGAANDVVLFRGLLAAGVGDYLVKPLAADTMLAALRRVLDDGGADAPAHLGKVVAVMGVRGGCGASTVAGSLAHVIARARRSVLVDLDLHFGSAGIAFGLEAGTALAEMLATPDRIDAALIAAALQPAGAQLGIITTAAPLEHDASASPEAVQALLTGLRAGAEWVVADLPRRLDATSRQVLRTADRVVLVAPPTLEGLRDATRLMTYLGALRAGAAPLLVVNGGSDRGALDAAGTIGRRLFEDHVGVPLAAWIPDLAGPAAAAAAHALPLAAVAGGRGGNPFEALAQQVTGTATDRGAQPGWWAKWRHA